jgi:hypothetical protein
MTPVRLNKFIDLLLHPAVLALPVAMVIILLVPDIFQKYKIEVVKEEILTIGDIKESHDLDNDGISEVFYTGNNNKRSYLTLLNQYGTIDQWNFTGNYTLEGQRCIIGDYNNDNLSEIYPLIIRNDSLFLNAIDLRYPGKLIFPERFIIKINQSDRQGFCLYSGYLTDLNGDGMKEIVFAVNNGFPLHPRRVVAYDQKHDSVLASPELGAFIFRLHFRDINGDGLDEIAVDNYASANYTDTIGIMHDHSAYFILLTNKLSFYFKPVEYKGNYFNIKTFPIHTKNGNFLLTYHINDGAWGKHDYCLQITDLKGSIIKKRTLDHSPGSRYEITTIPDKEGFDRIYLIKSFDNISLLDAELNIIRKKEILLNPYPTIKSDIDNDGSKEILIQGMKQGEIIILRDNLSYPVKLLIEREKGKPLVYQILRGDEDCLFSLQLGNTYYTLKYGFNTAYYLQYPVGLLIYLITFGFILFIRRLQRIQLLKKYETEKRMAELQLISLRNQMDPHFTFNVLNTIGSAILQKKSDESYELLMKFSKMIRSTIHSANRVCRPLQDELEFVRNYLELQQTRHQGFFNFNVQVDSEVNLSRLVPKMVLQTYVENALKHGLLPRKGGGELDVSVKMLNNCLQLSVTDNGVGRQQAKLNGSVSTGVGLSIMNQYYQLLNRENTNPITEEFTDLFNEDGTPSGTRVVVCIPDGFVFPG